MPPAIKAHPIRRGCWLTSPPRICRIIATTRGVIMTTIHQLVRPLTIVQSEDPISETPNAPEMNDHIQDAMLCRTPANICVIVFVATSWVCESRPQPGGHHPPAWQSTIGSILTA